MARHSFEWLCSRLLPTFESVVEVAAALRSSGLIVDDKVASWCKEWTHQLRKCESRSDGLRHLEAIHAALFPSLARKLIRRLPPELLVRQVIVGLEMKLGRMQSLRSGLFARLRKLFALIRDLGVSRRSCFLRKKHRRLINQTDFAHDHALVRLRCALPVYIPLSSPEAASGPVNSLR